MPSTRTPPTGAQHVLTRGEQTAVVTEMGATLRDYRVGDRLLVDGFPEDARPDGGAARCWRRGPTGCATAATRSTGRSSSSPSARWQRQRDPRARPVGRLGGGRAGTDRCR